MIIKLSFTIAILLVSTGLTFSFHLDTTLNRIQRSIETQDESSKNFGTLDLDQLNSKLNEVGHSDLLRKIVEKFLESQQSTLSKIHDSIINSNLSVEDLIELINKELDWNIIIIQDDLVKLNIEEIENIALSHLKGILKARVKSPIIRSVLEKTVKQQIQINLPLVQNRLENTSVPLKTLKNLLTVARLTNHRSKRSIDYTQVIIDAIREEVQKQISPLQKTVYAVFTDIEDALLLYYVAEEPEGNISQIVSQAINSAILNLVELIALTQKSIDDTFNEILYGTGSTRKRREINVEEFLRKETEANQSVDVTTQKEPSIIIKLITLITRPLNLLLKSLISNTLTAVSPQIGELVVLPIKFAVGWLLNLILPCNNCPVLLS